MKIMFALSLMFSLCAAAQNLPAGPVAQSNAATRLFADLCIPAAGNSAKLNELAKQYNLRTVDALFSQKILKNRPGMVWSASNSLGDFLVISQANNSCSVWARRADAATSIQQFKRIITGVERPGLQVNVVDDRDVNGQGGTYHYVAYFLSKTGQTKGMYASIGVSTSSSAEAQVRLRLLPAKSE
ncbi:NMCC_0638 family (lipo)protein [Paraburkholderia rhynchosiae]|uniref:Lipoprotein n=1 Tax=Paraburkholderia rhynchosiae TaxID=487049 RepID=A0A2N7VTP7_9BURK|nr:hypothetical protein [Paraburkholderia rhynchosiae]PMS20522.1 hypothetical protein C0Z16_34600 [Paraburkholderia rhynchosiae]CAB3743373.1 hypothetical protein LMG27174_06973 [Paraburkholderia rhynchosiae]